MRRSLWAVALAVLAGACAASFSASDVSPSEIPRLEALRARNPDDAAVLVRLGVAYGKAGREQEARTTLEEAVKLPAAPPAAWAYLAAQAERQQDYAGAEAAYLKYIELGGTAARQAVEARLAYVRRQLLVLEAQRALQRETELAQTPPDPATVAVMPLVVEGPPEYEPIGRGLAEMLTADLSLTDRLKVLERSRLQALLDEFQVDSAGLTDPGTAARAGRLTQAGRVVQGRAIIPTGERTQLQALVVNSARPEQSVQTSQSGAFTALLQLEVALAISIYRELGIELTAAELARLQERPAINVQAFLEYSRGLAALDAGNFAEAASRFSQAAQLDPGFEAAAEAAAATEDLTAAEALPPDVVLNTAATEVAQTTSEGVSTAVGAGTGETVGTTLGGLTQSAAPAGPGAATTTGGGPTGTTSSTSTNPAQSTAGEGVRRTRTIPIVVVRPKPAVAPGRQP